MDNKPVIINGNDFQYILDQLDIFENPLIEYNPSDTAAMEQEADEARRDAAESIKDVLKRCPTNV